MQVKLTALQLLNQCDLTVISSIVPHPRPTGTLPASRPPTWDNLLQDNVPHPRPTGTLPASQPPTRDNLLQDNEHPSYNTDKAGLVEDKKLDPRGSGMVEEDDQGEVDEVIMIDDISSNEEVAMEPAIATQGDSGQAIISVDGSRDNSHIDLDQDDDNDDLHIAFEKFVDQSSDASTTE